MASLIRTEGGVPGEIRSTLYRSVRAFAGAKLAPERLEAARVLDAELVSPAELAWGYGDVGESEAAANEAS